MGKEEKDKAEETEKKEIENTVKTENTESDVAKKTERPQRKPVKANRGVQAVLCLIQHIALMAAVIAVLWVFGSSTIEVDGFRAVYNFHLYNQDEGVYEDSGMFNTLFGYELSDIVRHGVVSSQLETGGRFDSNKVIDVTAYNYRNGDLPERYVTAEYYLGDLLKWNTYGFEWSSLQMTQAQAAGFLADRTRVMVVDHNSQYYNTSDASYMKADVDLYTYVSDVSGNQVWIETDDYDGFVDGYTYTTSSSEAVLVEVQDDSDYDNYIQSYNVLVNRYKTVENKNLEEYVSDWDLYADLCRNVQYAANELAYNYNEYLLCNEYYKPAHSNVRYMIVKTVGEDTQIFSNMTEESDYYLYLAESMISGNTTENMLQNASDRYIYYSPSDMVYKTNTAISEDTVRQIFQGYDYAYPEKVKMWMSVDSTYPAEDGFRQGMIGYSRYRPYIWQGITVAVVAGIIYLVILFYLTCVAGKDADEEGRVYIRLSSFDDVPTEIAILLACGSAVIAAWIFLVAAEIAPDISVYNVLTWAKAVIDGQWFGFALAVYVFVVDIFAMLFFYSLVRRIRAKTLWSNSLLRRMISRVTRFVWKVYDNGDIVLRTWIPYGTFLLFNVLMGISVLVFKRGFGLAITVIFAAAIDVLVGNLLFRNAREQQKIVKGIETIAAGQLEYQLETEELHGDNLTLANSVNSIGKGIKEAVEISMKDERMKADLITNVSHDIKTPLTSIINYVDLIKREQVENEKVRNYINVLDEKSQRLKQLTDDLVETSKISSGNISLHFEKINLTELMNQTIGEFSEKFELKKLTTVMNINVQNAVIEADSRRIWRVIENLFNNIYKYAMEGTRVYLTVDSLPNKIGYIALSVKNISASPLNCDPEELTERFIRGDESRTTEGSGLGLSIAKNLTLAQKGTFEIQLDGDLFKVILTFPLADV